MSRRGRQLAVVALAPCLLVSAWLLLRSTPNASGEVYAYDTASGQLYTAAEALPPLAVPGGGTTGVLAHAVLFEGDTTPTVVYLLSYTPEARELILREGRGSREVLAGTLVRSPEDAAWTATWTPEGQAIRNRASAMANGRAWSVAVP